MLKEEVRVELRDARKTEQTITAYAFDLDDHDVAALAFDLWQARGCPIGSPDEDWFHAVELLQSKAENIHSKPDQAILNSSDV